MRRTPALAESPILAFRHLVRVASAHRQKFLRVLRHAAHQHLEMKVWPRGSPRVAHFRHFLTALDQIALFHKGA